MQNKYCALLVCVLSKLCKPGPVLRVCRCLLNKPQCSMASVCALLRKYMYMCQCDKRLKNSLNVCSEVISQIFDVIKETIHACVTIKNKGMLQTNCRNRCNK